MLTSCRLISRTTWRHVKPQRYCLGKRRLNTSTTWDAKSFIQREVKIFCGIAITGLIGGGVYYYGYRKRLPNQVYDLIEQSHQAQDPFVAVSLLLKAKAIVDANDFSQQSHEFIDLALGQCYNKTEQFSLAKASLTAAVDAFRTGNPSDLLKRKRLLICALNELAQACEGLGENESTEGYYLGALNEILSPSDMVQLYDGDKEGMDHVAPFALDAAATLNNLGAYYVKQGRIEAARSVYMRCVTLLDLFGLNDSIHAQTCKEILAEL